MIPAAEFVQALDSHEIAYHTGVPCSYLAGPIARLTEEGRYVPAANEGSAIALAAGAQACGVRTAVFGQNSGFGNMINPLTSLVMPYRLPLLVFMSMRGWPDPDVDEPQHRVMGVSAHRILETLGVRHWTLDGSDSIDEVLGPAVRESTAGRPAFVLVRKGALGAHASASARHPEQALPTRRQAIADVTALLPDALMVSTTGYISRELFGLADSGRCFYMQGSMGHAAAFGLGVALVRGEHRSVVVLDGDGAALMHLGTMSTVGAVGPPRLIHVIFDNGIYESTGGQATSSTATSFTDVGTAVGYRTVAECRNRGAVLDALQAVVTSPGPHLIVIRTAVGSGGVPPRATSAISAPEIHARFAAATAGPP